MLKKWPPLEPTYNSGGPGGTRTDDLFERNIPIGPPVLNHRSMKIFPKFWEFMCFR